MPIDVERIRAEFGALDDCIYLNTGGTGPLPNSVVDEITGAYRTMAEHGPDVPDVRGPIHERYERTRQTIASFLGVEPGEIAFIRSISEGLSIVAYGMDWEPGDEVIVTDEENQSGVIIWLSLAEKAGIKVRKLPLVADRQELLSRLEGMLTDRTRLLSFSDVTTDTGTRLPAAEICRLAHRHGIPVVYDAAQSVGQYPVDLREIDCDFYVCTGHKWLLSGWGVGMLYVRKDWVSKLKVSWTGAHAAVWDKDSDTLDFADTAQRFEFGGRHEPLYNGLGRGIEFVDSVGLQNVRERVTGLTDQLKAAVADVPGATLRSPEDPSFSTGIVTFSVDGLAGEELNRQMWERWRVLGRPALRETAMRLSVAFFNTEREIQTVISAIGALASENR